MKISFRAFLLFFLFFIVSAGTLAAQITTTGAGAGTATSVWSNTYDPSGPSATARETKQAAKPLSSDTLLNYFDVTTPIHTWQTPFTFNNGANVFYGPAERFTLPTEQGYLDSIHITFDGLQGDTIYVLVDPDTLYQVPNTTDFYHFVNIYDPNVHRLAAAVVPLSSIKTPGSITLTVTFPHVLVPKNFHVLVEPRFVLNGTQINFTSNFGLRGDSEATRPRTADNCHSTFIYLGLQGQITYSNWVVDSFFIFSGDPAPLFSNFDIQAFAAPSGPTSAMLGFTVPSFDFGTVTLGSSGFTYLYIKNTGGVTGTVESLSIDSPYRFATPKHSLPYDIAPGDSLKISLTFAPTVAGSYPANLTATLSDGSTITLPITGIGSTSGVTNPENPALTLSVYPNPAASELRLDLSQNAEPAMVDLLDLLGRTVASAKFTGNTALDVSRLEPGRYEAVVHTSGSVQTAPVLIQH